MKTSTLPRIALLLGDPCGIGPEIVAKLMAAPSTQDCAKVLLVGSEAVWSQGAATAQVDLSVSVVDELPKNWASEPGITLLNDASFNGHPFIPGVASAEGGEYVLTTSRVALELAQQKQVDGLCFAPFNKQAMHLAGSPFEDDLRYFAHVLEFDEYVGELNVLDDLWSARVTSHVPLREVAELITPEAIEAAVILVHDALIKAGTVTPRIAVAALNPHAGEGGLFGNEEIDVIEPIVTQLASSINVSGPYPSDTVFLKAQAKEVDAVVTMYHDQGQVAMKLMGFSRGVTVHGGLPVIVTTPAHGTAFDIVGQSKADKRALTNAFQLACRMASARGGRIN
ncbi:MAG: 4-hydroxythreonine-4-phosphate dehydrogenase PdxA [Chloroflexota bacterium]